MFGRDSHLQSDPIVKCNYVRVSDEMLEKRLDTLIHESFAEKHHDTNTVPSVEDKVVLQQYRESIKVENDRYIIGLPFKEDII